MEKQYSDYIAMELEVLKEIQKECYEDWRCLYGINKQLCEVCKRIEGKHHGEITAWIGLEIRESYKLIEEAMEKLQKTKELTHNLVMSIENAYISMPPPGTLESELPAQKLKS